MIVVYWYISDFFSMIGNILVYFFNLLGSAIDIIKSCVSGLGDVIAAFPLVFFVPLIALIAIGLVYKILGREGSD